MFYLIIKQIEVKVFIHNFWEAFGVTADLLKVCNRIDGVLKLIVHCICMFIVNEHTNKMNNLFQYAINSVAYFTPGGSVKQATLAHSKIHLFKSGHRNSKT